MQTARQHTGKTDQSARLLAKAFEPGAIDRVEWEASWQEWSEETFDRPARGDRSRNRRNHRRENWK